MSKCLIRFYVSQLVLYPRIKWASKRAILNHVWKQVWILILRDSNCWTRSIDTEGFIKEANALVYHGVQQILASSRTIRKSWWWESPGIPWPRIHESKVHIHGFISITWVQQIPASSRRFWVCRCWECPEWRWCTESLDRGSLYQ